MPTPVSQALLMPDSSAVKGIINGEQDVPQLGSPAAVSAGRIGHPIHVKFF